MMRFTVRDLFTSYPVRELLQGQPLGANARSVKPDSNNMVMPLGFAVGMAIVLVSISDVLAAGAEQFSEITSDGLVVEMVVIPEGEFVMGSPDDEAGRSSHEGPQKTVRIAKPFALGRTEVTVKQFAAFVAATGHVTVVEKLGEAKALDSKTGRLVVQAGISWRHDFRGREADENLPVIRVSWHDAKAFAAWLAKETGQDFRLPSEAEFEYALRAGSNTRYWWGSGSPERRIENLPGGRERLRDLRWPAPFRGYTDGNWGPAEVASFEPNPFGLFDMGGNITEWTEDCYAGDLSKVSADGSPHEPATCEKRVMRGSAWALPPPFARSAFRDGVSLDYASALAGFRVARSMAPATESMAQQ